LVGRHTYDFPYHSKGFQKSMCSPRWSERIERLEEETEDLAVALLLRERAGESSACAPSAAVSGNGGWRRAMLRSNESTLALSPRIG
jgi:hypothetical protein